MVCIAQFSDILLYTHELASGQYSLDATLQLKGMKVDKLLATQHNHAFTIVSTQKSFQLLAESDKERDDWLQSLKNAIQEHARKYGSFDPQLHYRAQVVVDLFRLSFCELHNNDVLKAQDENVLPGAAADFVLGEMAPVWISDDSVSMCMGCMTHFSFSRRRHHCRGCGKVINTDLIIIMLTPTNYSARVLVIFVYDTRHKIENGRNVEFSFSLYKFDVNWMVA